MNSVWMNTNALSIRLLVLLAGVYQIFTGEKIFLLQINGIFMLQSTMPCGIINKLINLYRVKQMVTYFYIGGLNQWE